MPLDDILQKYGNRKNALIPILQGIQKEHRYLPREVLHEVCVKTDITPADIFAVSTFYDQFRHTPAGEHTICAINLASAFGIWRAVAKDGEWGEAEEKPVGKETMSADSKNVPATTNPVQGEYRNPYPGTFHVRS
jgi:hypothetical protein